MRKYKETLVKNIKEGSMIVKNHGFAYKVERIEDITENVKLLLLSDSYGNTIEEYATIDRKYNVREDELAEDWQKVNRQDNTDGLSQKAVDAYRRENPGSKLKTAVTENNPKGKRAARRKSFCRRMSGMKDKLTSSKTARDPDSRINKALRRWNCNSSYEPQGTMIAESEEATIKKLAKMHDVGEDVIKKQLEMGMKIEKEHTNNPKEAMKIAVDHLEEKPDYYTKLKKYVEGNMKEEMDPKDHVRKNKDTGMFCVYDKDGKKVKEFESKKDAEQYAMKNHKDLMEKKDHEHSMGRSQISTIMSAGERLKKRLKGEGNLPAWVQAKLTKAADYLDSAADYMDSGEGEVTEGKIYDRLVQQLRDKGTPLDRAHAIATAQLQKSGVLKRGTRKLTKKGKKRQAMGAAGRAKDRAANRSGRKPSDYNYNPRTNGATLKNSYEPEGNMLEEGENKPTNPSAWADCIRQAKSKFKVYPSAYANGWAAKCYKKKGGGWKKAK